MAMGPLANISKSLTAKLMTSVLAGVRKDLNLLGIEKRKSYVFVFSETVARNLISLKLS